MNCAFDRFPVLYGIGTTAHIYAEASCCVRQKTDMAKFLK
jgi:hypothetical protein